MGLLKFNLGNYSVGVIYIYILSMIEGICPKSIMNCFPNGNRLMILRKQGNQLLIYPLPSLVHYIYIYIYI